MYENTSRIKNIKKNMTLNVTNLGKYSISFLIIFGIGFAILIGVSLITFLLSKISFINKIFASKNKKIKIVFSVLYGLFLGIIFGFFSLTDYWQKMPIFTFVNFSLLAVFAYRYSLWIFMGALIPEGFIIYFLYAKLMPHFSNNTFVSIYIAYICFAYITFIFIGAILRIFNTKNKTNLIFLSGFIGFVCLFFIILLVTYLNDGEQSFSFVGIISLDVLFSFSSFLIYYLIHRLIINFFKSYSDILQSGNYAEPGIPNQKYGIKKISDLILKNNIKYGFTITLKCLNEESIIKKYGLSSFYKIRKLWNEFLIDHFPFQNYLEFINKNNDYCIFVGFENLPTKIELKNWYSINQGQIINESNLNIFNDYLKQMPEFVIYNNKDIKLFFKTFISLYNIHSCEIDKLIDYNQYSYLINQKDIQNKIYLFDPSMNYNPYATYNDAEKLDNLFKNGSFDIKFKKVNEKSFDNQIFYYPDCLNLNLLLFNKLEAFNYAKNAKILDIFQRHLASLVINKASEMNLLKSNSHFLLIDYPWTVLNVNVLNIKPYLLKLENVNIKSNNIILTFNLNEFDKNKYSYEYISHSLLSFQENGFKIAFMNVNENNLEIFKYFIPDYSFFINIMNFKNEQIQEYYKTLFTFLKQKNVEIIY